jgi:cytosine deaminase
VSALGTPVPVRILRSALLPTGDIVDLELDPATGTVATRTPVEPGRDLGGPARLDGDVLDLQGMLLLPAGAEPHTHLDKALSFDTIRPGYGGLAAGIAAWQSHARTIDEDDYVDRARRAALELLANGVTAVRTHAEVFGDVDPLVSVRALVRVREKLAHLMTLQIVVLAKPEVPDERVAAALDAGADLVGGSPHNTTDPAADLGRLMRIARERGVGIDIHADERLDPAMLTVLDLARAHLAHPFAGTVTAGHCVSLGLLAEPQRADAVSVIASAGVGVVACPLTNLYLQGRDVPVATPRGVTAARALIDAGALFAGAGDNIRDPLNPLGAADALATAGLLVAASHLTIEEAFDAVTAGARRVMGLPVAGTAPGDVADLTAVRSATLAEAVARAQHERVVLSRGRLVASRTSQLHLYAG